MKNPAPSICKSQKLENKVKILTLTFLFFFLSSFDCSGFSGHQVSEFGLKGPVKSLSEVSYLAEETNGGVIPGKKGREWFAFDDYEKYDYQILFDELGNITEEKFFLANGKLTFVTKYTYEKPARLFKITRYNSMNQFLSDIVFFYNPDGTVKNKFGTTEKEFEMYPILDWPKADYDYYYSYDTAGNISRIEFAGSDGTLSSIDSFQYDVKGNKTAFLRESIPGGKISELLYEYDTNGKCSTVFDMVNNNIRHFEYVFDEQGNISEEKSLFIAGADISISITKYTYDAHGNWIQKISYIDDKAKYVVKREINYY